MGSPYFVHKQANRIHVIKTYVGLKRVLPIVLRSMGDVALLRADSLKADQCSPEWVVIRDVLIAYRESFMTNSRAVIFLEARYEWLGWDKFQRVIVLDNCSDSFEGIDDDLVAHYMLDDEKTRERAEGDSIPDWAR